MYQGQLEERRSSLYARPDNSCRVIGLYNERSITGGYNPNALVEKELNRPYYYFDTETRIVTYGVKAMAKAIHKCALYVNERVGTRFLRFAWIEELRAAVGDYKEVEKTLRTYKHPGRRHSIKVRDLKTGKVYPSIAAAADDLGMSEGGVRNHLDQKSKIVNRRFDRA